MPRLNVWIIRCSLIYLMLGATIGAVMLAGEGVVVWTWIWQLRPLHVEFLLFGWMVQLAFGVGSWILPRIPSRPGRGVVVAAVVLLNAGIWTVGIGGVMNASSVVAALGRMAEIGGFAMFTGHIIPRVVAYRR